mmetsp:Transcript_2608/g.4064  ORF Transcript_2608/g.4064 Transcript_2608/m.4064 type:complete len:278 (-) Transcript_2608:3-836(-)
MLKRMTKRSGPRAGCSAHHRYALIFALLIIIGVSVFNFGLGIRQYVERNTMRQIMDDVNAVAGQAYFAVQSSFNYTTAVDQTIEIAHNHQVKEEVGENMASHIIATKTNTTRISCPEGQFFMEDRVAYTNDQPDKQRRLIPNVLYQTSKSRCLTNPFKTGIESWREAIPGLSNIFHDDEAMDELLNDSKWENDFPNLKYFLQCVNHADMPVMKADVWRYLIVWENGGIYSDLDNRPGVSFSNLTIREDDDAFFTIDGTTSKSLHTHHYRYFSLILQR